MIKNLIFDLDNTIIKDDDKKDSQTYKEALKNCGYNEEKYYKIYVVIDEYDKSLTEQNMYYNEKDMLDFINKKLETQYEIKLIDELLKVAGKYWTKEILIQKEIIEKLALKYNLYVYTNYFTIAQEERLKNIGYLKYFKKVFGADKYGSKPFKKSLEKILNEINAKPNECIMIGDDKSRDILVANKVNMKSILFDFDGKRDKKICDVKDYIILKDFNNIFEELSKIENYVNL